MGHGACPQRGYKEPVAEVIANICIGDQSYSHVSFHHIPQYYAIFALYTSGSGCASG